MICKGIFWFKHKWTDWEDKEKFNLTNRSDKTLTGLAQVQERHCVKCKRKNLRTESTRIIT